MDLLASVRIAVGLVVAGVLVAACAQSHAAPDSAGPASSLPAGLTSATPTPAKTSARGTQDPLLQALEVNQTVRQKMTGVAYETPPGTVLCSINVVGHNAAGNQLYAWLMCANFTTGANAAMQTGTAEAALITTSGSGADIRVTSVHLPSQATLNADIDRMFPAAIAAILRRGTIPTSPTDGELLAFARGMS